MAEVPIEKTQLSEGEAEDALRSAFARLEGRFPSPAELELLYAHAHLETAGFRSMHNFNFGNVILGSGAGNHFVQRVPEFIDGEWVKVDQKFRAYPNASAGAYDFLSQLRYSWGPAFDLLETGDPEIYARALKEEGLRGPYYTAPLHRYTKALASRMRTVVPAPQTPTKKGRTGPLLIGGGLLVMIGAVALRRRS